MTTGSPQSGSASPASIRDLVIDLLGSTDMSVHDAADKHLAPDFRQKVNGRWLTRQEFVDGIGAMRPSIRDVAVTVLDELRDDTRYAERHLLTVTDTTGTRASTEVSAFATVGVDGRFVVIEEASIVMSRPPRAG